MIQICIRVYECFMVQNLKENYVHWENKFMPHKHFTIPDTLPTKSIKIGLQPKDRLMENTHLLDAFHC